MAGDAEHVDESKFTGFAKYFNTETKRGRANWAMATYAGVAVIGLYFYLRKKKPASASDSK